MAPRSIKTNHVNTSTQTILIHSGFLLIALSYLFYLLPNLSTLNHFHIWAPAILGGIDVITMYVFFFLISYYNKSKIGVLTIGLLVSCAFLYYSAGINIARTLPDVLKISEVPILFYKGWTIATIPRLGLVLMASLLYYALFSLIEIGSFIKKYIKLEFLVNLSLVCFLLIYRLPSVRDHDFIEVIILKLVMFGIFYHSAFIIIPLLLKKKKYLHFCIFLVLGFLTSSLIVITYLFYKGAIINNSGDVIEFFSKFAIGFAIITALGLLYGFIRYVIIKRFKKTETALGNTTSELLLLKSQVNPHFLFNTLNTLYATALEEKATVTASATAKLANLVRYMQQDMQQEFIPLEREAGYVSDYINIQKLRIASPLEVNTVFEDLNDTQISPGLLIPFVENAFKYGIDPDRTSRIDCILRVQENTIYFRCKNEYNINHTTYYREKGFGIGIKNTRERLDLIYPKKYQLDVEKTENLFTVTLNINTL